MTEERGKIEAPTTNEELINQLKEEAAFWKKTVEERSAYLEHRISTLEGIIDGLKFAIRCNGISGKEVE